MVITKQPTLPVQVAMELFGARHPIRALLLLQLQSNRRISTTTTSPQLHMLQM